MSRKWIGGLVADRRGRRDGAGGELRLGGGGSDVRPAYATVTVDLGPGGNVAATAAGGRRRKKKKPKVVYLREPALRCRSTRPTRPRAGSARTST